ncbi:MAG: hypothetical protein PVH29_05155 [Candidatus Zixiibacteriota bacterium]|jgi:hypothetical protein
MRLRISFAALAATAALCAATPPAFVEEDFEGSQFPPEGWTASGSGSDWGWSNPGGYADGYATSTVASTASCRIYSPPFYLEGAQRVRATFRYVATGSGGAPTDHAIYFTGNGVCASSLPKTTGWEYYEWVSPSAWAYTDFRIGWVATVYSPYNSGTGILRLDDVEIVLYNVGVSPTSIGRVKALYR